MLAKIQQSIDELVAKLDTLSLDELGDLWVMTHCMLNIYKKTSPEYKLVQSFLKTIDAARKKARANRKPVLTPLEQELTKDK